MLRSLETDNYYVFVGSRLTPVPMFACVNLWHLRQKGSAAAAAAAAVMRGVT